MNRYKFLLLFFLAFLLVAFHFHLAYAHGTVYFEFAPDVSDLLNVAQVQTPSQSFYPPNDHVGGVDLWIDNAGAPGSASFGLRDSANNLLTSTTVTIPTIASRYGGTRFHIDFPAQILVQNNELYRIRAVSSMPSLRLYYSSQFQILQHSAQSYPYYMVEPALLGSTPQNFAFKFALSEVAETTPPVISNATTTAISATSERIDFNANEPVDFRISYAAAGSGTVTNTNFSGTYTLCLPGIQFCNLTISVEPSTTYNFDLYAKDEWGNQTTHSGSFTSAAGPPPPPGGGDPPPPPPPPPPGGGNPPPPPGGGDPPPPPPGGNEPPPPPPGGGTPPPDGGSGGSGGTPPPPSNGNDGSDGSPPPPAGGQVEVTNGTTTIITWNPPPGMSADRFRIKIYDENNNLIEDRVVSAETRRLVLEKLGPGRYLVYVYAEHDGILTQIGEPISFNINLGVQPQIFTKTQIIIAVSLGVAAIAAIAIFLGVKRSKKKPPPPSSARSKSIWDKIGGP